jgi:DNA-directed RNA polymerase I subunit RPA49
MLNSSPPTDISRPAPRVQTARTSLAPDQLSPLTYHRYLPALYDPSTSILHIHPSAPLYLLVHRVKRLKNAPLISQASKDQRLEYRIKRNDLGEVFGTRKAKSQIRAEERNRVDVGAMQAVKGHLMESIGEKAVVEG